MILSANFMRTATEEDLKNLVARAYVKKLFNKATVKMIEEKANECSQPGRRANHALHQRKG